jgi:hypothetical protein
LGDFNLTRLDVLDLVADAFFLGEAIL